MSFHKNASASGGPKTPYRGSAPGPRWGTSVPQTSSLLLCPPNNPVRSTPLVLLACYIPSPIINTHNALCRAHCVRTWRHLQNRKHTHTHTPYQNAINGARTDRATVTDNTHKNWVRFSRVVFEIYEQTDKRTYSSQYFVPSPYGRRKTVESKA